MRAREIKKNIYWMGAIDWDRREFDSLVPLPEGTSYNAYLIRGSEKTALLDTVEPNKKDVLLAQLENVEQIDYVISHHAEQDHSGAIPDVLEKYPNAILITNSKAKQLLIELLNIPENRVQTISDGEELSLGDKTLQFIFTPWVHWPETMTTYLKEDYILFSCDFFGSHVATSELYANQNPHVYEAAKLYYAEIMMPFRRHIQKHLDKLKNYKIELIAPSHGPVYNKPTFILDAYQDFISDKPRNEVVIPYISMHGSTQKMVDILASALTERNIIVHKFNLDVTDIGKLALVLVDAGTIVVGSPMFLSGLHPKVVYAAYLANTLKPKLQYASFLGSFSWGGKAVEQLKDLIKNLKVEILEPVVSKGLPTEQDVESIINLADTIKIKHENGKFF
jgi:flavorubredoxin